MVAIEQSGTANGDPIKSFLAEYPQSATQCLETLSAEPQQFLRPSQSLHSATLALAKHYLDPVALSVSTLQLERLNLSRKNRKRKLGQRDAEDAPLRLKKIALDGFNAQQVWEQISRVTEAVDLEIQRSLEDWEPKTTHEGEGSEFDVNEDSGDQSESESLQIGDNEDLLMNQTEQDLDEAAEDTENEENIEDEDNIMEEDSNGDSDEAKVSQKPLVQDKFGLNDGFFSIDEFNKRTEMLEQQDAIAEPDADAASDEEDIDWDADPRLMQISDDRIAQSSDEEGDDDGPTFGNVDLLAPEGASDEDNTDDEEAGVDVNRDDSNSNNLMYADFFDQPSRRLKKSKTKLRLTSKMPLTQDSELRADDYEPDYNDNLERTITAVHRDLFSEESEPEGDITTNDPDKSNHERRKAAILAQIRELEALNISARPWTLSGEATARDRPINGILEEDLDFERTGKPLPVITAETSEEIEQLIKRRILASEFDEVRRRRPDEVLFSQSTRRGRLDDVDLDVAPKKGLAEMYEEEHLRRTDPNHVDQKKEKINKEHAEIEILWKDIVTKLDSLASWRYKPKPAEITVSVRSDAPAMRLEDARPSGASGDVGSLGQLAPQEIYKPGEIKEQGKLVTRGGAVLDRAEMSQDNRKRHRRREKERLKKGQQQRQAEGGEMNTRKDTAALAGDLKKSGVKVIGRKGELRDVEGKEVKDIPRVLSSSLKL
jgi:U3 small nucleolar RNA-associated protein MPP10